MDRDALFAGPQVSLEALLAAREARAAGRAGLLKDGGVLVGVSVVMPGPVKDCAMSRDVAQAAGEALGGAFAAAQWFAQRPFSGVTAMGPEAFWIVEADAHAVKTATIAIEESHPLGRLFDLDVETASGALSRSALGVAPRRCLICDEPARACGRAQRHSLDELRDAMTALLRAWSAGAAPP